METFKQRMKRIRVRAGFRSQAMAADAIGCERGTVGMWEAPSSSVQAVSSEWLFAAATAYRVRPEWINDLRSARDGYPWAPSHGAEPFTPAPTAPPTVRHESQSTRPDPDILHEALTLLAFSEEQAGDFSSRARSAELLRLYDWCAQDGGRLSEESNDAFEASVWARKNRLQGVTDDARHKDHPERRTKRRAS